MKVGSLFSGCGGTALGFERAGYEHSWFVENNEYAKATLRKNFPAATIYGDIKEVDFRTVPRVDVLEGGFPCQDISNAGGRAGIEGSRSSLWKDFARAISHLRPRFVSIENVSALTSRGLDVVLCDLAAIGYDAEWHCFPASAVGAPHRRDRIFVLAYPNSERQLHGQSGIHADCGRRTAQHDVRESCEDVADADSERCHDGRDNREERCLQRDEGVAEESQPERQGRKSGTGSPSAILPDDSRAGLQRLRRSERFQSTHADHSINGWWSSEPDVGRVADGVSSRVDRIKCLGNAVVPQAAEVIAKTIKEVIRK